MTWKELTGKIQELIETPKSEFEKYDSNEVLSLLIRERFIARAAQSTFKDSIILKGGLLLTLVYTKSARYTGDADIGLKNARVLADYKKAVDAVLAVDLKDDFSFSRNEGELLSNEEREYDGAQFNIACTFDGKQRTIFILDIGVGDAVDPVAGKLPTLTVFETTSIEMKVYPPETIAAEKYHAVVNFGARNTRLKDFYDLFMLRDHVVKDKFKEAVKLTFERRKTELSSILPELPKEDMQLRWERFLASRQYRIIKKVPQDFQKVLSAIREFYDAVKQ